MSKTTNVRYVLILVLSAVFWGIFGCGDVPRFDENESHSQRGDKETEVVPQFVVANRDKLPDTIKFNRLELSLSEIRLEPLSPTFQGVVYASRKANTMAFDFDEGPLATDGDRMKLPKPGDYLVSVRLEPVETDAGEQKPSLRLSGNVWSSNADSKKDGEEPVSDGHPMPAPLDEEGDSGNENTDGTNGWTPFHYESFRTVYLTMGRVEIERGRQELEFAFDLQKWGSKLVEPVVEAVSGSSQPQEPSDNGVDVTRQVENTSGPAAFVGAGSVRSTPRGN